MEKAKIKTMCRSAKDAPNLQLYGLPRVDVKGARQLILINWTVCDQKEKFGRYLYENEWADVRSHPQGKGGVRQTHSDLEIGAGSLLSGSQEQPRDAERGLWFIVRRRLYRQPSIA
jgi:hypothetical protein